MTHRIRTLLSTALVLSLALVVAGPQTRVSASARAPQLRVVGPAGEDPPVVNEHRNIRLRVVDETGADVQVTSWTTGSPTVAKVTKKGVLKGRLYGFATITAQTGRGEAKTTVVVARVTRRHGSMGDGDTKSDSAGRIYLTSPNEQVIYRSDGVRDEIFAGEKGEAGYQEGTGLNARFNYPSGLGVDVSKGGGLYVADTDNHCIRKVGFDGKTSAVVGAPQFAGRIDGDVVPATDAVFDSPKGVASFGQAIFVADTRNHALYYLNGKSDSVSLLAGQPGNPGFLNGLFRQASFNLPSGLAINSTGDLIAVADTGNDAVRLVRIEGGGFPYLGRVSTVGIAGQGRGAPGTGFTFVAPTSVAFDSAQNVCVVDSTGASVVTRPPDGPEARVLLAQTGSLGRPASVVVSGTKAIVADADAVSSGSAFSVVEVGAPKITSVSRTRVPEGIQTDETLIEGENFPPEARVVVDGTPLVYVRVESSTRMFVGLPVLARGSRLISVITRGGVAQTEIDVVPPTLEELSEGEITTYAGTGTPALGDGGRALDSTLDFNVAGISGVLGSGDVRLDGTGNVYFASPSSNRVRRIDAASGVISTVVGTGKPVVTAEGSPGTAFGVNAPMSVAIAPDGAIVVADTGFDRVVRVDPISSEVTTVLGEAGRPGSGEDGDLAGGGFHVSAPNAIAIDRYGNLFVSDSGNKRVLRVEEGTGIVHVVAGGGALVGMPEDGELATSKSYRVDSLDVDDAGILALEIFFRTDVETGRIVCVGDDNRVRVCSERGSNVALDEIGGLLFSDRSKHSVVRLDLETGGRVTIGGGGMEGVLGEGGPATKSYLEVVSLDVDGSGNVFVADQFSERIRRIDSEKRIISSIAGGRRVALAGEGRYATSASVAGLKDIAWVDGVGLCIADAKARGIRVVDPESGNLSTPIGNGVLEVNGSARDGAPALGASVVPFSVAAGGRSRVLFVDAPADGSSPIIWMVGQSGILKFVAGHGTNGADGAPAQHANLGSTEDILQAPNGDIFVLDSSSRRVRKLDASSHTVGTVAGRVHTGDEYSGEGGPAVAATLATPRCIALARNGDLYIAEVNAIRRVDTSGTIHTVAGGTEGIPMDGEPISAARFGLIGGMVLDGADNLLVADYANHLVLRLDFTTGLVTYIAGIAGVQANTGDGYSARGNSIALPSVMAIDSDGRLYVATESESGIRSVRVIKLVPYPHLQPSGRQRRNLQFVAEDEGLLPRSTSTVGAVGKSLHVREH